MDYATIAAYFALAGTSIQAYLRVSTYKETNQEVAETFSAIEDLRSEFSLVRHPIRRRKRRREIRRWLKGERVLRSHYRQVRGELFSWILLVVSAAYVCLALSVP